MGIAKRDDRRPWSPAEEKRLATLMGQYCPSRVAKLMHRSINSVVVKSKRLGISRRARDGWFTKREVCVIFAVDHKWLQRRIDAGALKASWHYGRRPTKHGMASWHIQEADLKDFIRRYPGELQSRNLDIIMIVDILAGVINGQMSKK